MHYDVKFIENQCTTVFIIDNKRLDLESGENINEIPQIFCEESQITLREIIARLSEDQPDESLRRLSATIIVKANRTLTKINELLRKLY